MKELGLRNLFVRVRIRWKYLIKLFTASTKYGRQHAEFSKRTFMQAHAARKRYCITSTAIWRLAQCTLTFVCLRV